MPLHVLVCGTLALLLAASNPARAQDQTGAMAVATLTQPGETSLPEIDPTRLADDRLTKEVLIGIARTVDRNQKLLGADAIDFCHTVPRPERLDCLSRMRAIVSAELEGIIEVISNSELEEGGHEWPNADSLSNFRRVGLSVTLRKGAQTAQHDIAVVVFDSVHQGKPEVCIFPMEHWEWSEMHRPERFAQAPVGYCNENATTLAQYLLARAPEAQPSILRFVSQPEARAWQSREPARIRWDGPYTSGHPWAKYFLLDSYRWWRGGNPTNPDPAYGWAVRIPHLPLSEIAAKEKEGHLYLDVFEDAAQIELTTVQRPGIDFLLEQKPEVLVDTAGPGDTGPRLRPLKD